MISHDLKCVFIHIPKCAGTSVYKSLKLDFLGSGHAPASKHFDFLQQGYFSFSFVRNPWDRISSCYRYFQSLKPGVRWYRANQTISDLANSVSFNEFVNYVLDFQKMMIREKGSVRSGIHFQPFSYFLDTSIDFVGKVEDINHDYMSIRSRLNLPLKQIPKINSTKNQDYKELYNEETRNIVYNIYKEDIEKYNYEF
tara:strand:- start:492 stop:1082 length:591 start_codon:yes stop_codon:yes gene_type:complete